MEQLGFLEDTNDTSVNEFCNNAIEILKSTDIDAEKSVSFKRYNSHTTILLGENIACLKIVFGTRHSFFAVSPRFKKILLENGVSYSVETSTKWLKVEINEPTDIFIYKQLVIDLYNYCMGLNSSDSFDCCSRYMQCSDALKCVNPHPEVYKYCKYKNKLKKGIVYYGKNRNI